MIGITLELISVFGGMFSAENSLNVTKPWRFLFRKVEGMRKTDQ